MTVWLDDLRPMPGNYTRHVKSADEAIALLATGQVTHISLDHDLGPHDGTGYEVACWIEEQAHLGLLAPVRCSVHSQNPVGAANMRAALKNAYRSWGI